jgi:5-methylcytosine-specific restriction endonuclease McrA
MKRREYRWRDKPKVDKSGLKFGRLTVVSFSHYEPRKTSGGRDIFWKCVCDCGGEKIANNSRLLSGSTRSCGCLHQERMKALHKGNVNKNAAFDAIVRDYKRGAKARGLEFSLTVEQIKELIQQRCFYCCCSPSKVRDRNGKHIFKESVMIYNGIDRVDNNVGYVYNNCVPCCEECNWAKGSRTQKEFLEWISRLIENRS